MIVEILRLVLINLSRSEYIFQLYFDIKYKTR